ncbi:MAG: dTDP-glucose 4,6-dehydratase [Devosia sp.]|nr:dTDP-glucose 4,6-dehydratase [Devosia sp.]
MNILVTGGAGFIGSAVCRLLAQDPSNTIVVLDKLTYAGNPGSLAMLRASPNYVFVRGDIADEALVGSLLVHHNIDHIMHLAAETHVDRSIDAPAAFMSTNVMGSFHLLQAALGYWRSLSQGARRAFRFHHVSTDEVFGDLPFDGSLFSEATPYAPSSPYSASKAASDHLVRAWNHTFGLPIIVTNCSNNYGPFQFPEKLVPLTILNALEGCELPVYGSGNNVRDWLHVEDHARALVLVSETGEVGQSYNIGGRAECANLELVQMLCLMLDQKRPRQDGRSYGDLIALVPDRPGHDRRYGMDTTKIERELGWRPRETLHSGMERTVEWYLDNRAWWRPLRQDCYAGTRLGAAFEAP